MNNTEYVDQTGPFEVRYLHRYCARMVGPVMDGEDVVQETLSEAYRKLDKFDDTRPLKPWLFRIAHNRCIDFLRRRGVRDEAETTAAVPEAIAANEPVIFGVGSEVEHLISTLPPKERACVLLKDVFDYSLEEIADLVDSTVGGVKAALIRGRTKLASAPPARKSSRSADPELTRIMQLHVDRFNRLNVADAFAGKLADAPYFTNYERWSMPWRLQLGDVEGEPVVVILQRGADTWTPYSAVRLRVAGGRVERITDYAHCPWMIPAAAAVSISSPS
jgi:RNA polymerase sigma-70 factor (ECF subfamily)